MRAFRLTLGSLRANAYLVEGPGGALLLDPGDEPQRLLVHIQETDLRPRAILLTHAHFDHVGAVAPLVEALDLPVFLHPLDLPLYRRAVEATRAWGLDLPSPPLPVEPLEEGQRLWGVQVLHLPGHSPGHVAFFYPGGAPEDPPHLFSGDLLFRGGRSPRLTRRRPGGPFPLPPTAPGLARSHPGPSGPWPRHHLGSGVLGQPFPFGGRMRGVNGADAPQKGTLEALRALYGLQEKDLEIDRLQKEVESLPEDLLAVRAQVEALERNLESLLERQAELRREYQRHSLDIEDLTAKEKQAEAEQRQAQSAREQTQYENRIQQIKDRIRELLELSTPLMEAMEDLEAEVARAEAELAQLRPRLEELLQANEVRVEALRQEIVRRQEERAHLAAGIPTLVLREYEAIRRARRGTGVVRMLRQGQVFRCEGCNVVLPTHVAQKVIQGQLVRCPSCGRLLWKGD